MKHFNTKPNLRPFSQRAALVVVGLKLQTIHLFDPIATGVHIAQKVVHYTPAQKLQDALVLAALAEGLSIAAAVRVFGFAESTITTWLCRAGMHPGAKAWVKE